jgi:MoxR-like ATPase
MVRLSIGYPGTESELDILATHGMASTLDELEPVADAPAVAELIELARHVHVSASLRRYIVDITEATRTNPDIYLGASPRASIMLMRAARAFAAAEGRDYVIPDDVKTLALPVLAHRIILTADAAMTARSTEAVLSEVLAEIRVPVKGEA